MKLPIGDKLKSLRNRQGITQERLAEALGVSCQSVSRWELGACYPDLELLPALANYFGVTLDELVGMEQIRSEENRNAIFTAALDCERQQRWEEAIRILRSAVRTYPNDDGLLTELALALSRTEEPQARSEAIALSEKVLSRSTNEKLRSTARANLCFLYQAAGMHEKALALGRTLPHIWECREMLLPDLVRPGERAETVKRSLSIAQQVLRDVVQGKGICFSLGYGPEERFDGSALADAATRNRE